MKKKVTMTDAFKSPFYSDAYHLYIIDSESNTCFNFLTDNDDTCERIVNLMNGEKDAVPFENVMKIKDDIIGIDGRPVLLVRGWGHLTGGGGLDLDDDDAIRLQNEFVEFTIKQISK